MQRPTHEKSRSGRPAPLAESPAPAPRKEKYANLVFLGFNAAFLVALFWLLPALGTNFPAASAEFRGAANGAQATESRAAVRAARTNWKGAILQYARLDLRTPR